MATRTRDLTVEVDGLRAVFSLPEDFVAETLEVYLNGVRQRRGQFFTESAPRSFVTAEAPRVGDGLAVQYETGELAFPVVIASGLPPLGG